MTFSSIAEKKSNFANELKSEFEHLISLFWKFKTPQNQENKN